MFYFQDWFGLVFTVVKSAAKTKYKLPLIRSLYNHTAFKKLPEFQVFWFEILALAVTHEIISHMFVARDDNLANSLKMCTRNSDHAPRY